MHRGYSWVLALVALIAVVVAISYFSKFAALSNFISTITQPQPANITYLALSGTQIPNSSFYVHSFNLFKPSNVSSGFVNSNNTVSGFSSLYAANSTSGVAGLPTGIYQITFSYKTPQSANYSLLSFVNGTQNLVVASGRDTILTQLSVQNVGNQTYAYELTRPTNGTAVFFVAFTKRSVMSIIEESCAIPTGPGCGLNSTYSYARYVAGQIK